MSLQVPTTAEVSDNIVAQIGGAISQTIPILPKAFVRVLAKVLAGVFILLFKYAGWIFFQLFVAHASMQETTIGGKKIRPLVEWGRLISVGDPLAATRAQLSITVTVKNQTGSIPAGSSLLRTETGILYQTIAAVALNAPTVTVTIEARSDQDGGDGSGTIGNLVAGDVVSFANPAANWARDAVVASQVVTAADAETTEAYRARIFKRFQRKPQGGAYADYQEWAETVPGIIHAYPYTDEALPGHVLVFCEATEASSGSPDGIPTSPQLAAVVAAINFDEAGEARRRPANAALVVDAITRTPIDVVITGFVAPPGTDLEVSEGLSEYLLSREPFIVGLSVLPRDDRVTVAAMGGVVDQIVAAAGGTMTRLEFSVGGDSQTAYTLGMGEKVKLGTVAYA